MTLTPRLALLMTLPPLLWAGNAVVGRLIVGSVPPLTLNFVRWVIAALILLPLGWRALRDPAVIARRWRYLFMLGLLGTGCYNAFQYLALVTTTPINATLIAASMPVGMLAVGALVYGEHPSSRQWLAAALSMAGVLTVIARGDLAALADVRLVRGDLYMLVAILAWSFYSWLLVRPPASMRGSERPDWNWAEGLLVQVLFGLAGSGLAAAVETAAGSAPMQFNGWVVLALAFVAIGPAVIAYRCWGIGVATGGPTLAALFSNLTPLFAALLSAVVLGELPHWYHALAFVFIVAGIATSSGFPRRS
jgi:drug/metabolite transporter (DMT)-like permease